MKQNKKTIKNSILGFIIGDALGVSVEFEKKNNNLQVLLKPEQSLVNNPKTILSDDTFLMLCLMHTMTKGYCKDDYYQNIMNWYCQGKFSLLKCEYSYPQNIAIYNKHLFCNNQEINYYNKCIMRCLPLIFDNKKTINFDMLKEICHLTHTDIVTDIATYFYVYLGKLLYMDKNLSIQDAFKKSIIELGISFCKESDALKMFDRLFKNIHLLSVENIKNTGDTVETLETVLWCLLTTNSYKEAIIKAISLDGDVDTISALVGGLAGLYYSNKTIFKDFVLPFKWTTMISEKYELKDVINNFTKELVTENTILELN